MKKPILTSNSAKRTKLFGADSPPFRGVGGYFLRILLPALLVGTVTLAQNQVQITVNVLPPYSAYLQDYPAQGNKVQIFVRNLGTAPLEVRLSGQVTGDNGVSIATDPYFRPAQPLRLGPLETKVLARPELEKLFDVSQFVVQGMDKATLLQGRPLPEGAYQLCVQAFDNRTSRALSAEFPLGCSAPFQVRSVEPPILIAPLCDADVPVTFPQNVVFTWAPPVGVLPTQVQYTLRVVELPLQNVDPNVYIDAVVLPASGVEVRNLRSNSFLYSVQYPALTPGKKYAYRVQASDPTGRLVFLNDGKSPVCAFQYGGTPVLKSLPLGGNVTILRPGKCGDTLSVGINNGFRLAWRVEKALAEKIKAAGYPIDPAKPLVEQIKGASYALSIYPKNNPGAPVLIRNVMQPYLAIPYEEFPLKYGETYGFRVLLKLPAPVFTKAELTEENVATTCSFKLIRRHNQLPGTLVKGKIRFRYPNEPETHVLPNARLRLFYVNKPALPAGSGFFTATNIGTTVQMGTVDATSLGTTSQAVLNGTAAAQPLVLSTPAPIKEIELGQSVQTNYLGEYEFNVQDWVKKVQLDTATGLSPGSLRVQIDNPYFAQPAETFTVPIAQQPNLPDLLLLANGYRLTVKAAKTYDKKAWPDLKDTQLDGQLVVIFRKPDPYGSDFLPPVEGMRAEKVSAPFSVQNSSLPLSPTPGTAVPANLAVGNNPLAGMGLGTDALPPAQLFQEPNPYEFKENTPVWTEENLKATLKNAGFTYVASGQLKTEGSEAVVRFNRMLYWTYNADNYFIYCPNLGQDVGDAKAFKRKLNGVKLDPNVTAEEEYKFDIVATGAPLATFKGRLLYRYPDPSDQLGPRPMAKARVRLVLCEVLKDKSLNGGPKQAGFSYWGNRQVLATDETDDDGSFNFNAYLDKPYKLGEVIKNFSAGSNIGPHGQYITNYTGTLYRTLRVEVDNPFYAHPSEDFGEVSTEKITPLAEHNLGDLTALVQSYTLGAKIVSDKTPGQANGAGQPLKKVDVYILRRATSLNAEGLNTRRPDDDGQNLKKTFTDQQTGAKYVVVAYAQTNGDGYVAFPRLVRRFAQYSTALTDYTIAAFSNVTGQTNTEDFIGKLGANYYSYSDNVTIISLTTNQIQPEAYANDYSYRTELYKFELKPAPPRIVLRVRDKTNPAQGGLSGVTAMLLYKAAPSELEKAAAKSSQAVLDALAGVSDSPDKKSETSQLPAGKTVLFSDTTDANGYVRFDNLAPGTDVSLTLFKQGYFFQDTVDATKFHQVLHLSVKEGLTLGQNYYNDGLLFTPNTLFAGNVVAEKLPPNQVATPVDSYVQVDNGFVYETYQGLFLAQAPHFAKRLKIIPKNLVYFEEDLPMPPGKSMKMSNDLTLNELGDFTVYERQHRIIFKVLDAKTGKPLGAYARLFGQEPTVSATATFGQGNYDGLIKLRFKNASVSNLFVEIGAIGGYVPITKKFSSTEEKTDQYWGDVFLEKAQVVRGTVVLKENGKETPLKGAEVYFAAGGEKGNIVVKSGADGTFELPVPAGLNGTGFPIKATYTPGSAASSSNNAGVGLSPVSTTPQVTGQSAGEMIKQELSYKPTPTYKGTTAQVVLPQGKGISYKLVITPFEQFSVNDLWGFPVKVEDIATVNGVVQVTGEILLNKNAYGPFRILDPDMKVRFEKIPFVPEPGNPKRGVPKGQSVDLSIGSLEVGYSDQVEATPAPIYNVKLKGTAYGQLPKFVVKKGSGTNDGYIPAQAQVIDNSFSFPSSLLHYEPNQFSLSNPDAGSGEKPTVVAYDASGKNIRRSDFALSRSNGDPLELSLLEFKATSSRQKSRLKGTEIHLAPDIECDIPNAHPQKFTVSVEKIVLKNNTIAPQSDPKPLTFKLSEGPKGWSVAVKKWVLDYKQGGFYYDPTGQDPATAVIKTGQVDVPITQFNLRHDHLFLDAKVEGTLPLADVTQMQVTGKSFFGYDPHTGSDQAGHWSLVVVPNGNTPAATVAGLPGLEGGLSFQVLSLLDNGENVLSFGAGSQTVKVHSVMNFSPSTVDTGPDYFAVVGAASFPGVPRMPQKMLTNLTYRRKGGQVVLDVVMPKPVEFETKGYVKFKTTLNGSNNPEINLEPGLLVMRGTVEEPGELKPMPSLLVATPGFTRLVHDRAYENRSDLANENLLLDSAWKYKPFDIAIGDGKALRKAYFGAQAVGGDWNLLQFSGLMDDFAGITKGTRTTFTVHGAIKADGQGVGLSDMNTPLGAMDIVYEFPKKRLTGSLQIPKIGLDGGMSFEGAAQFRFDKDGFYIASSGVVYNVPLIVPTTMKSCFMIGWYGSTDFKDANPLLFMYTHRKDFPSQFPKTFQGFFVLGEVPLPILGDIHESIDLEIVSAEIGTDVYVDGFVYGQYASGKPTLGAGAHAMIRFYAGCDVPGASVSGEQTYEGDLQATLSYEGGTFDLDYSLGLTGSFGVKACVDFLGCLNPSIGVNFGLTGGLTVNPTSLDGPHPSFSIDF